jgi:membrane protease YdiL (CAAX protease family)
MSDAPDSHLPEPPPPPPESVHHVWNSIPRGDLLLNTIFVEGGLAVLAIVLAWLFGPDLWAALHCSWMDVLWGTLGAIPPLVIILLIDRYPIGPFRQVADISDRILRPLLKNCKWPDYFLLATLAGFCEELLFRGWLQPFLGQYLPLWSSIVIGGFVFGLCHLLTAAYFVIAWLISIYLAMLLVWSDNLLVPMVTHGVYDLIAIFAVMSGSVSKPTSEDI